jgi:hypothetical protein
VSVLDDDHRRGDDHDGPPLHVLDDDGAEDDHHLRDDHVIVDLFDDDFFDVDDIGHELDDHDRSADDDDRDDVDDCAHDIDHATVDHDDAGHRSGFDDHQHDGAGCAAAEPSAHRFVAVRTARVRHRVDPHGIRTHGAEPPPRALLTHELALNLRTTSG